MKGRLRDFLVGATALLGLAGLATMLFLFGELQTRRTYLIEIAINTADGLSPVSPITLNGVKIGSLKAIAPAPNPYEGVLMQGAIYHGVSIPRDVTVSIDRTFVGDATLALRTPAGAPGVFDLSAALQPGDRIEGTAQTLLSQVSEMLDQRLGSLDQAATSFAKLSETYTRVGERVEALLSPASPEAVARGEAEANIATAIARVDQAAAMIQEWLGDEQMRADARQAVSKAATLFDQAAEAVESWNAAAGVISEEATRLGSNTTVLVRDFANMSNGVSEAVQDLRMVVGRVNDGEGTLGQLVTNPDLYNSITDAARRLEKALTEAQLLVEKYRKEGIPIQW